MLGYLRDTSEKRSHNRDITSARALTPHFTGKVIERLVPQDIANYKMKRRATITSRGTRVSDATIGKELMLFSAAIKHANLEWGWELPNILKGRIPLGTVHKIRWLRQEEAEALKAQALKSTRSTHLIDFIELSLATAMRRDEVLRLEWDRVDFGQRLIYLNPENQKGKSNSSVPLNEIAVRVLRKRHLLRQANCPRSPWVFATAKGERIASIKKAFYYAAEKAGLPDISPHTLRHTVAAWLVQAGVPLRDVCEVCRHKDIRTTMRYAHLAPQNSRTAMAVLDGLGQDSVRMEIKKG
jgi:integrase